MVAEPDVNGFVKRRDSAPKGFFAAEAAGLAWLVVPGGVRIARVLGVGAESLTVQRVPPAAPTAAAAEDFGRRLAVMHDAGAPHFGAGPDGGPGVGWIGDAPLPLRSSPPAAWGGWYAEDRVLFHARRAGVGDAALTVVANRLAGGHFDDDAPPARIHGDLWSGNVLWSPAGAVLVDPAAHGGHRETDLAMLALFGLPHLDGVLGAYAEAAGLDPGWRARAGVHQLHPLLVHALLFGGGYGTRAVAAAARLP